MSLGDRLKNMKLFSDFTDEEIQEVARVTIERFYPAGTVIIKERTLGEGLYFIQSGTVLVKKSSLRDDSEVLAELGEGEHFGEMSIVDNHPTSAEVVAGRGTICQFIPKTEFFKLLKTNREAALKIYMYFAKTFCQRLRRTDEILLKEKVLRKRYAIEHIERIKDR